MPMMPMEPANAVMMVRPFLVRRLFADSERREKAHRGLADGLARGVHFRSVGEIGVGVGADDAVGEVHRARGVLGRQLRVVGDHYDQIILAICVSISMICTEVWEPRRRWAVGQHDLRVVDERAGDGDALHLAARELARRLLSARTARLTPGLPWRGGCARPSPRPSAPAPRSGCRMVWCGMRL